MKSFAMLTMSGLLAASLGYAVPALADDTSGNGDQSMQQNSDNGSSSDQAATPDSDASSSDGGAGSSAGTGTSSGSNDSGSPDTATGDDDY